ncbi:MAG TPA: hypothetical protein VGV61_05690 [Thermoanaerobaculia bacterium]|jgi:hypothetical protein|nr:hypothetical protein [Thermoanaerobaculia bacterium]
MRTKASGPKGRGTPIDLYNLSTNWLYFKVPDGGAAGDANRDVQQAVVAAEG